MPHMDITDLVATVGAPTVIAIYIIRSITPRLDRLIEHVAALGPRQQPWQSLTTSEQHKSTQPTGEP